MKLTALKYGETLLSEKMVLQGGDPAVTYPISLTLYLIETENRRILVDAGCDTMPGFELFHFCGPVAVLKDYGLSPEEITDVILTHRHHDHVEAVGHFSSATVWIQRKEYEACRKHIGLRDRRVILFDEECAVADGITVVRVGGHTEGSSVVKIEREGLCWMVAGDELYHRVCLERNIPTGVSFDCEKSRGFLSHCREEEDRIRLLLAHESDLLPGKNGFFRIF